MKYAWPSSLLVCMALIVCSCKSLPSEPTNSQKELSDHITRVTKDLIVLEQALRHVYISLDESKGKGPPEATVGLETPYAETLYLKKFKLEEELRSLLQKQAANQVPVDMPRKRADPQS